MNKFYRLKEQISQKLTKQLYNLYTSICPLSLKYVKTLKVNNKLFTKFNQILNSKDAQHLRDFTPSSSIGDAVPYIEDTISYPLDENILDTKTIKHNHHDYPNLHKFTKRASKQFKNIYNKGYLYAHFESRMPKRSETISDGSHILVSNTTISSQFNIPSKRLFLKMIKHALHDVSMANINFQDKFAIEDNMKDYQEDYHDKLNEAKQDKQWLDNSKKALKYYHKYFHNINQLLN